jgi:hypothetical protein
MAAVWSASCSAPPHRVATAAKTHPVEAHPAKACFAATPQDWGVALRRARSVTSPPGIRLDVGAVAGQVAYGQYISASATGIGSLDLRSGRLTRISTYGRTVSGMGAMAADGRWLVWEELDSMSNPSDWSVRAYNTVTKEHRVLATSRLSGGGYARGQQPLPVIWRGRVAWAQPTLDSAGRPAVQLRIVDLASGEVRVLDRGSISSPVVAGPYLIWGKVTGKVAGHDEYEFRSVDARTLRPVALPRPLAHPASIGYLAGSEGYFAWSSLDETAVTIWRIGSGQTRTLTSHDGRHFFQFMQIAGHFMIWFSTATFSVLDLVTDRAFDIGGTVTASPRSIVVSQLASRHLIGKTTLGTSRVSTIATATAPGVVSCG